jgi:hypothetical protein
LVAAVYAEAARQRLTVRLTGDEATDVVSALSELWIR